MAHSQDLLPSSLPPPASGLFPGDTIVAVASAPGTGARAVVRLSGARAWDIALGQFRPHAAPGSGPCPLPRTAARRLDGVVQPRGWRNPAPAALALWPEPRTYTRQRMAEFHLPGCRPLVDDLLADLEAASARAALPGEFTLRAFLGGRIDLAQAEAVLGVIDAASPAQLATALRQLAGGLSGQIAELRQRLLDLLAHLEAGLDFVDEDIAFITPAELSAGLVEARDWLERLQAQLRGRAISGPAGRVVLLGLPNAGKSSLFNALVGGPAALVSDRAGTTRDYLRGRLRLDEADVELIDTAGAEPAVDSIGRQAQEGRQAQSMAADLRLLCIDASRPRTPWELRQVEQAERMIVVLTKIDRAAGTAEPSIAGVLDPVATSARTGEGLEALRGRIRRELARAGSSAVELAVPSTGARCRASLGRAADALGRAMAVAAVPGMPELVAVELRDALDELGQVVGATYTDDILDRIFSRFCIGK